MNQNSYQALTAMLNAFPQSSADLRALLLTYEQVLSDVSDQAISDAAMRFMRGEVPEQSKTFAPSLPEFRAEAVRQQEVIEIKARPRLAAPAYIPGPLPPFMVRRQKALADNAHLPVLFEDVSYDQWRKLSAAKQVPTGAKWVAALGTVYGSEPKRTLELQAETHEGNIP